MIDPHLEREGLTVLPLRLETITIVSGPASQHSEVSGGNQSGGASDLVIDGNLGDRFNRLLGFS